MGVPKIYAYQFNIVGRPEYVLVAAEAFAADESFRQYWVVLRGWKHNVEGFLCLAGQPLTPKNAGGYNFQEGW